MKLTSTITAPKVKSELRLRDLKPGALFRFVEPQGQIKFGLIAETWGLVRSTVIYFYSTHSYPISFDMEAAGHYDDLVELIEGPDAFVTLTSNPD